MSNKNHSPHIRANHREKSLSHCGHPTKSIKWRKRMRNTQNQNGITTKPTNKDVKRTFVRSRL